MMNNIFWNLLVELKELCEANHIEYWLGGGILRYTDAVSEEKRNMAPPLTPDFGDMELIMDGANAKKLLKLADKLPENRMLEYADRNPLFRNLDIYYINTESTCIDFRCLDRRRSLGVFIPVRILQPDYPHGIKQTYNIKIEKMWRLCYSYHHFLSKATPKEEKMYKAVNKYSRGRRTTRLAFHHLLGTSFDSSCKSVHIYKRRSRKVVDARYFAEKRMLNVEGVNFVTVSDAESYLEKMYGDDWATKSMIAASRYVEADVSHKEFEKALYENDGFWTTLQDKRQVRQSNKANNIAYQQNWDMAKSVYAGITLQDRLLQYLPVLENYRKQGDYAGILNLMEKYPDVVLQMNKDYGVEIDSKLKRIYTEAYQALEG